MDIGSRLDFPNQHITPVSVVDPRLNIQQDRDYVVLKGSQVNSFQQFFATNLNNNSVQITCNPPNSSIAISRLILKQFVFNISVTGTNTGASNLLVPNMYAPRFLPIMSVTNSESMAVNNDTISIAPLRQFLPAMLNYHTDFDLRNGLFSLSAGSMQDQFQEYSLGIGSQRNPLANYSSGSSYDLPRGAYIGLVVNTNTSTSATLTLTVTEPLIMSPFVWDKLSFYTSGLVGVESMAYTCTFADLNRCMSFIQNQGAPGVINITSVTTNLNSAALLFNYLTPSPLMPIPRSLVSSYFSPLCYPTRSTVSLAAWTNRALPPPGATTLVMNSVQLSSIPRRVYIFARRDDTALTQYTSDTYLALPQVGNPLRITWGNNQFMSQASSQDIYNISKKNGYSYTYSQWSDTMGAVICLDFGIDIGLDASEAPSLLMNQQFGLSLDVVNTNPTNAIIPTLYVLIISEGTFNLNNGSASHSLGVLSRSQIINSRPHANITYQTSKDIYGGSFYDKLKNAAQSANRFLKRHKVISTAAKAFPHPAVKAVGYSAQALGYGGRRHRMRGGNLDNEEIKSRLTDSNTYNDNDYDSEDEQDRETKHVRFDKNY